MLTVPDQIKALLHQDHCQKNIRIHFPSGERSDICNDLIVKDSVSFTESLCSQSKLKFGLSEASVFECETVGVGNIKGATIEVSCEIFCDQSDEGAEWRPDLQHYIYSIPYGTFVVDESKRQSDMNHRRIVAYSGITVQDTLKDEISYVLEPNYIYKVKASNPELLKNTIPMPSSATYQYDLMKRISARLNVAVAGDYQYSLVSLAYNTYRTNKLPLPNNYGVALLYDTRYISESSAPLQYIEVLEPSMNVEEIIARVIEMMADNGFRAESDKKRISEFLQLWYADPYSNPIDPFQQLSVPAIVTEKCGSYTYDVRTYNVCGFESKELFCYPLPYYEYGGIGFSSSVNVPAGFAILNGSNIIVDSFRYRPTYDNTGVSFRVYTVSSDIFGKFIYQQSKVYADFPVSVNGQAIHDYGYIPDTSVNRQFYLDNSTAAFELQGLFGKVGRKNVIDMLNIQRQFHLVPAGDLYPNYDQYPEGVTGGNLLPGDYQTCWYDDEYTKPFGAVHCIYKNTSEEDIDFTMYLPGFDETVSTDAYQTYEISENAILKGGIWTAQFITSICNVIAGNIKGVQFMPVDFTGRGLPYVEAGDTFEILTASNDSITTIVLNRTLTGEQTLTDSYKSV